MQSARQNGAPTKATGAKKAGGSRALGKGESARFDGAKVRNENAMAATMATW